MQNNPKDEQVRIVDGSNDHLYYTQIPNIVLETSSFMEQVLYVQYKKFAGDNGTAYPSQTTLMARTGTSKHTLIKYTKKLVDRGWLTFVGKKSVLTRGGYQEVNEYRMTDIWEENVRYFKEKQKKVVQAETTPLFSEPKGSANETILGSANETYEEKPKKQKKISVRTETSSVEENKVVSDLINKFAPVNPSYRLLFSQTPQRSAIVRLLKTADEGDQGTEAETEAEKLERRHIALARLIDALPSIVTRPYAPRVTTPCELERNLGKLRIFVQQEKAKGPAIFSIK